MSNIDDKISGNGTSIHNLAYELELDLQPYSIATRDRVLANIKEMRRLLIETTQLITEVEEVRGRGIVQASDTMPCAMCNDHYKVASEYTRGVRWEPVPGKGWVYVCWECAIALEKMLSRQLSGLTYTFLFSLDKETRELVKQNVKPVTELEEDYK